MRKNPLLDPSPWSEKPISANPFSFAGACHLESKPEKTCLYWWCGSTANSSGITGFQIVDNLIGGADLELAGLSDGGVRHFAVIKKLPAWSIIQV
ncbi:MAG: hypothetical protein ACSLE5_05175 [Porticoccaceae bacterium]